MSEKIQLFCIPYAGGMAGAFDELKKLLADEILVTPIEYAGHGTRKTEAFYQDFGELAGDVRNQMRKLRRTDLPCALMGYSMGSISVYEILRRYGDEYSPKHIFLASHEAPDVEWEGKAYARLEDEKFMDELIDMGGFRESDRKLLGNRFFKSLYFQPIREDYRLLAEYRMEERCLLSADVTVFYSPEDISDESIHSWDRFAGAGIEYIPVGEDHFFIREHAAQMADVIRSRLIGI